ncbi:uncharacterized protein LOC129589524 [Paramacrobiotus metropolitanus]|uniref:uncharacterized protein LOC129589524 n=1 Tax=Paramacrobiotus metropolitanus TaxID=2943436 RepID=UPI0024459D9F|nr:uncharacterized protein LOC129589524 [Paramacrobiotus metropolitanus]
MIMANATKILKDRLYLSQFYDKFAIDVVRDSTIYRGYVVDVADDGLIIDYHHSGPCVECVRFSCARVLPIKLTSASRYCQLPRENEEVLTRNSINHPLTWTPATCLALVPEYGDKPPLPAEEVCAIVRITASVPPQLLAAKNEHYSYRASQARVRQARCWMPVTHKTFEKFTVRFTACSQPTCPFPVTPLSYMLSSLDVGLKLFWLQYTGTLIISANDDGITVLRRQKFKRVSKRFHRLVFHLYERFLASFFRKDLALYRRISFTQKDANGSWFMTTWRKMQLFPKWLETHRLEALDLPESCFTFSDCPDDVLVQIVSNLDVITQKSLRRICRTWNRVLSCASISREVIVSAPLGYLAGYNQALYLADTLFSYTTTRTRAVLLDQFSHSHSGTILPVLHVIGCPVGYYLSYRHRSICLWHELDLYPDADNMHIYCTMVMEDDTRKTLEILLGTKKTCQKTIASSDKDWTYCCTTGTMKQAIHGIPLTLNVLNNLCYLHEQKKERSLEICSYQTECDETLQRLEEARSIWPIAAAATEVLRKAFKGYRYTMPDRKLPVLQVPRTRDLDDYESGSMFCPEILKVLIRERRSQHTGCHSSVPVASWLRFW